MTTTKPEVTTLTPQESRDFRKAWSSMPFAADTRIPNDILWRPGNYRDPITVDQIVAGLDALAVVLREYADDHRALERDHLNLCGDVGAMRRVLGTDGPATS